MPHVSFLAGSTYPTAWFSSCQNASTNESSVDDVVVTRLSASTFPAREAMMPTRCHYCATATLVSARMLDSRILDS